MSPQPQGRLRLRVRRMHTTAAAAEAIVQRLVAEGAPPFSYDISAYPDDPVHGWALMDVADRRLLSTRRRRGRGRGRDGAV